MAPSPPSTRVRSADSGARSSSWRRSTATTSQCARRKGSRRSASSGTPGRWELPRTKILMAGAPRSSGDCKLQIEKCKLQNGKRAPPGLAPWPGAQPAAIGNLQFSFFNLQFLRRGTAAQRPAHRPADAVGVQAQVGQQLGAFAVLDEAVGQAEADDLAGVQPGGVGRLQQGAAEAALQGALLDGDHQRQLLDGLEQGVAIERLGEAGV